jgi:T-complex protein 1 subunit eta
MLFAASFLKAAKQFVEEGVSPQTVIRAFRHALQLCITYVNDLKYTVEGKDEKFEM